MRIALALLLATTTAYGRPNEKWAQVSPERRDFFRDAHMPDSPRVSCCGLADAYEADDFDTDPDGGLVAIITCNEPDVPDTDKCRIQAPRVYEDEEGNQLEIPARPPGTRIKIPAEKILKPRAPDNKTGHGWVFINPDGGNVAQSNCVRGHATGTATSRTLVKP